MSRFQALLSKPVSIQSLAATRIAFGALLVWECLNVLAYDRIGLFFVEPDFHFTYRAFSFLEPLPAPWIYILWCLMGVSALFVALGLFYRVAIVSMTAIFAYFFLLDKAEYLNHFYMVILYGILMSFMPANRAYSLDAKLGLVDRSLAISYWPVFVLRLQTEIILIYSGIVKITSDWLQGYPLILWLRNAKDAVPFGFLFDHDWIIVLTCWLVVILHSFGAPLLYFRSTRLWIFLIYCVFHMTNAAVFPIGIFPWLTIAVTLIFFDPNWPGQLYRWWHSRYHDLPPLPDLSAAYVAPVKKPAIAIMIVWFAVQLALPVRAYFFPNDPGWTGDGHRFSWRMRIFNRHGKGHYVVRDAASGESWMVQPEDYLSNRQLHRVFTRPDMVRQFALHLEELWAEKGHDDVEVYAVMQMAFNGRPYQEFIDPEVDLTEAEYNLFAPDPWVRELTTPLKPQ
ncbi:HTTM domain-containing protein [Oceanomicrobium pacificus]|uniref:HTTM domain-containing protein n=1 Tax=Oceanomicrobium pacificus TaxID=2692916 RepID=A0A6B0TRL6_9RHOB|nr:HTTM domain-containing protein [Oceanomicrobium pacificus]MXU65349.1 HTTM domain-containing protein [Oceanomicrobium pacificus]